MKYVLIDRYLELEKGKMGRAVKTITHGEDFLEYQLSPLPCMPPSLLIEAQAQTAGVVVSVTYEFKGKALLAKVERADFYRPLTTGDRLIITARMRDIKGQTCAVETEIEVDGVLVARMDSLYAVLELSGEEGRPFDTFKFYAKRIELLRALGVLDLLASDPALLAVATKMPAHLLGEGGMEDAGRPENKGSNGSGTAVPRHSNTPLAQPAGSPDPEVF
jgi:3-hydroxyacyl-[acyl-carrier-protein] dehydratase